MVAKVTKGVIVLRIQPTRQTRLISPQNVPPQLFKEPYLHFIFPNSQIDKIKSQVNLSLLDPNIMEMLPRTKDPNIGTIGNGPCMTGRLIRTQMITP